LSCCFGTAAFRPKKNVKDSFSDSTAVFEDALATFITAEAATGILFDVEDMLVSHCLQVECILIVGVKSCGRTFSLGETFADSSEGIGVFFLAVSKLKQDFACLWVIKALYDVTIERCSFAFDLLCHLKDFADIKGKSH
jgi:hypothetical protein